MFTRTFNDFAPTREARPASSTALHLKMAQYRTLGAGDASALARVLAGRVQNAAAGVKLVDAGEAASDILVILSGWACSRRVGEGGAGQTVALHLPGDVCDFGALFKRRADCAIVALTDLKAAAVSRQTLTTLSAHHPGIMQALLWESMVACSTRGEWIARVAGRSARQRLANFLCEMAVRLYVIDEAADEGFALPITQSEIGGCCGLTPEHTNRTLRQFRDENIFAIDDAYVRLQDWDRLREAGRFRADFLHFADLREDTVPAPLAVG